MDFSVDMESTLDETQIGNLDEYDEASPMKTTYCYQVTEHQYEEQAATETEKAVQALVEHLEKDPTAYFAVLQKRKQEEEDDNAGFMTYLKSRMMMLIQGNKYRGCEITEEECRNSLAAMTKGMNKVFHYSQEAKDRRMSKRIAARQRQMQGRNRQNGVPAPPPMPPPVPPPALPSSQQGAAPSRTKSLRQSLMDRKQFPTPRVTRQANRLMKTESSNSLASVHSEMLTCNPLSRLRSTKQPRSPGGTPIRSRTRPHHVYTSTPNPNGDLNSSEPLTQAFLKIMEQKFKNIRSPSPSSRSPPESPSIVLSPGQYSP